MKNKKTVIVIISIVLIYLVLAIVLFGWENFINKFQELYIMLDSGDKWQLKDGKWSDIENEKDYNWKKFDVYIDNQLIGNYSLMYNNRWYLFDDERVSQKYEGKILAIKGNKKYQVIDFLEEDINEEDKEILNDILNDKEITYPESFTYAKKVFINLDDDQKLETIYTISNAFTNDTSVNKKFSLVFIKDDQTKILYEDKKYADYQYDMCVPKVNSIIDINKDKKYEIIIECNYYSVMGTCNQLYHQKDGNYRLAKGC